MLSYYILGLAGLCLFVLWFWLHFKFKRMAKREWEEFVRDVLQQRNIKEKP